MSKINIGRVNLEVVGDHVYLDIPAEYTLTINSIVIPPLPVRQIKLDYYFNSSTSSLANQIDQVEKSQSNFGDK